VELEPWINIADARLQAALTCVQYLTLDCFKPDLNDDEVRSFVHKGYYCFQDYAAVYWYDHVELCLSEASSGEPFVNSLLSALNLFLTRNWDSSKATEQKKKDRSVPIKVMQRLKVLQDTRFSEVFRKLTVLASARERLGAPSPFEFLNFRIQVGRARAILEGQHEPVYTTAQVQDLQKFYGHAFNHFKCRQESCAFFTQGFASARERQKHEELHDRSFRCTETTCPSAEIGFATNAELQSHLRSQHPKYILFHETEVDCTFNHDHDDSDHTFIVEASGQGQLGIVQSLIRDGIDINTKDTKGMTALHRACLGGHDDIVRFLVGVDHIALSAQDADGVTPLIQAAGSGHETIVRLLLEMGDVDANAQSKYGTALMWAAENGHETVVRLLLERGDVNANAQNKNGETALVRAADNRHEAVVRLLLERGDVGATVQSVFGTALVRAAENGAPTETTAADQEYYAGHRKDYPAGGQCVDYDGEGSWSEALHRAHPDWVNYEPEPWELGQGSRAAIYSGTYNELHLKSCGSLGKHKTREAAVSIMAIILDTVVPMQDILCAVRNGLDFGNLAAIGHIRWKKTLCQECNLRPALGNSTWDVPCIYRRFLQFRSTSPYLPGQLHGVATTDGGLKPWGSPRCDCIADMSEAELEGLEAQGLYKWLITNGTIRDATMVPPRRLWDLRYDRVVHFHGMVSKLCRECFDAVSMSFISVRFILF